MNTLVYLKNGRETLDIKMYKECLQWNVFKGYQQFFIPSRVYHFQLKSHSWKGEVEIAAVVQVDRCKRWLWRVFAASPLYAGLKVQ